MSAETLPLYIWNFYAQQTRFPQHFFLFMAKLLYVQRILLVFKWKILKDVQIFVFGNSVLENNRSRQIDVALRFGRV